MIFRKITITGFLLVTFIIASGGNVVMRVWLMAPAFAAIVAGSSFYAVVGSPFPKGGLKADAPVDKVHLFSAPKDIPHAPPTDLIATKLAIQPVVWPEPPKVREKKSAPPKTVQEKKSTPPKRQPTKTRPKPKKPVTVTGSL